MLASLSASHYTIAKRNQSARIIGDKQQINSTHLEVLTQKEVSKKERIKTVQNQVNLDRFMLIQEEDVLDLLIEVEFHHEFNTPAEKLVPSAMFQICMVLKEWKEAKLIDGVYVKGEYYLEDSIQDHCSWTSTPRIIKAKTKDTVECIFQVKSNATAFQLYKNQQKLCDEKFIKVSMKKTDMEHVQRIGFITSPYVQLASPDVYVQEINSTAMIDRGIIEIKKHITYEKGMASKVLMIYALVSEAKEIDERIYSTRFKRFKYMSYKLSDPSQRIGAMHRNEMVNIKSRYETLYDTNIDDEVFQGTERKTLEEIILNIKHGQHNLFMAIEQGVGKQEKDINVVLNPRVKEQARRWLMTEYPLLTFGKGSGGMTSVISAPSPDKEKYDKDLMEFLAPKLTSTEAYRTKKYGSKLKSYAEVLGMEVPERPHTIEKNNKTMRKQISKEKGLNDEIKALKQQISQLKSLVERMCTTLIQNKDQQNEVLESLSQIGASINDNDENQDKTAEPMILENTENPQEKASTKRKTVENNANTTNNDNTKIRKILLGKTSPCVTAEQESSGIYRAAVLFDKNNKEAQQN